MIPGSGRSPGGGHGNTLQYLCLENPVDRGAWWANTHGVVESRSVMTAQGGGAVFQAMARPVETERRRICCRRQEAGSKVPVEHEGKLGSCLSVPSRHPTGHVADVGKKVLNFSASPVSEQVLHKQDCRRECRMHSAYLPNIKEISGNPFHSCS